MTDYISRADAIEAVHKYFVDKINNEPHEIDEDGDDVFTDMKSVNALFHHNKMVSKAIKALPSADAKWIPCSERLPKEKQEVYVTVYFIEGDTGRAYGYMDGFGKWHLYSAVEGTLNSGYEVIAWMPLPKPYKGGDTE